MHQEELDQTRPTASSAKSGASHWGPLLAIYDWWNQIFVALVAIAVVAELQESGTEDKVLLAVEKIFLRTSWQAWYELAVTNGLPSACAAWEEENSNIIFFSLKSLAAAAAQEMTKRSAWSLDCIQLKDRRQCHRVLPAESRIIHPPPPVSEVGDQAEPILHFKKPRGGLLHCVGISEATDVEGEVPGIWPLTVPVLGTSQRSIGFQPCLKYVIFRSSISQNLH